VVRVKKLTPLRIAIADGAPFMRRLLPESLIVRGFDVAGIADSADSAIDLCRRSAPDVLVFDLVTEQMDGVVLMRGLRSAGLRVPVILFSGQFRADHYRVVDALSEGAFDFVERPLVCDTIQVSLAKLSEKIGLAANLHASRREALERTSERALRALPSVGAATFESRPEPLPEGQRAVVIVGSLGGCHSLASLVPALPPRVGIGTVVVQQLPEGFTEALADRLDRHAAIEVREARGGETLTPGSLYIAPGGSHLRVAGDAKLLVSTERPVGGLRPRVDLTLMDATRVFGERLALVVISGIGKDGVDGARAVKEQGGKVLVEAESSAIASGTPRAIVEARLADAVLPIDELPGAITEVAGVWSGGARPASDYVSRLRASDSPA
jgi:two-component system chemotaxis response regulator CheB